MVVLSVAILSKSTPLLARQFVEMTKIRVQGLLSAFPKLLDKGATDHTFIETENVRYIYQPIEALFILLITNKHSNILEDLDTLRFLAQVVQETCKETITEEIILTRAFDIVFAFDEVISFGYRDLVTINQIKDYTQMESTAEVFHNYVQKRKEDIEKSVQKEYIKSVDKPQKIKVPPNFDTLPRAIPSYTKQNIYENVQTNIEETPRDYSHTSVSAGMVLEPMHPKNALFEFPTFETSPDDMYVPHTPAPVSMPLNPITINTIERVNGRIHFEGSLESLSAEGSLETVINNSEEAGFALMKISEKNKRFKFSVHPSIDKSQFNSNILKLRDQNSPHMQSATLVKWRLLSKSEDLLPFNISCWPSKVSGGTNVTIEIELNDPNYPVEDVHVQMMCPDGCGLEVSKLTGGSIDKDGITLHWRIPYLNEELDNVLLEYSYNIEISSGSEFKVDAMARSPISQLQVLECIDMKTNNPIDAEINESVHYNFILIP